jgi:hypothetical protein
MAGQSPNCLSRASGAATSTQSSCNPIGRPSGRPINPRVSQCSTGLFTSTLTIPVTTMCTGQRAPRLGHLASGSGNVASMHGSINSHANPIGRPSGRLFVAPQIEDS